MGGGFRTIGLCSLHFPVRKWPSSVTILSSQWQGYTTPVGHLDLWIETTMNLNSKLKQELMQILYNKLLFATTRNANNITRMKAVVQQNLKCQHLHMKHFECQPSRMKKDGQAVHDLQVPCMILMLIPLASSLQHWGQCSLDWWP